VESFRKLVRLIPRDGLLIACADYPEAVSVAAEAGCPVVYYAGNSREPAGIPEEAWAVRPVAENGEFTRFLLESAGVTHEFALRLPGRHNAANGAAAAIALLHLGYGAERVAGALAGYAGVRRRQEVLGEFGGVLVIDDFAHHPTAVRETILAVRARYPGRRVIAVFEPRSNTSRRRIFQKEFAEALSGADSVVVAGVFGAEKIPLEERLAPEEVTAAVRAAGRDAFHIPEVDRIVDHIGKTCRPGDLVLIMSNGGFGGIQGKLERRISI
jgi:UDP-N-acetylmuramate: L-alanyl-gamma-D-glutamyl-meso-diaminopimelate ligase